MRNASLPGLAKLPCGCVGKCTCSPLKFMGDYGMGMPGKKSMADLKPTLDQRLPEGSGKAKWLAKWGPGTKGGERREASKRGKWGRKL